jgi:hypothetical protein
LGYQDEYNGRVCPAQATGSGGGGVGGGRSEAPRSGLRGWAGVVAGLGVVMAGFALL